MQPDCSTEVQQFQLQYCNNLTLASSDADVSLSSGLNTEHRPDRPITFVSDDAGGARLAVEHFCLLGRRRIAYVSGPSPATGMPRSGASGAKGDRAELDLEMSIARLFANPEVRQDIGRVALARGPLI